MTDKFLGAWRVCEYVYDADGTLAGIIKQQRRLHQLTNGRIRVWQQCEPDMQQATHPMNQFTGEWVFELEINGRNRLYHGPDVIGSGVQWLDGVMIGQGIWPQFGHNFTSFAFLPTPNRQLTGGKFFNASQMIANIIGVATPFETSDDWPTLTKSKHPHELTATWQGQRQRFGPDGTLLANDPIRRVYDRVDWIEIMADEPSFTLCVEKLTDRLRLCDEDGNAIGIGKEIGPLLEFTAVTDPHTQLIAAELFDAESAQIMILRRCFIDHAFHHLDMITLVPSEAL